MNHEQTKQSRKSSSDGFLGWFYDLLFPRKNAGVDDAARESSTREAIPEQDNGRAAKLFAQIQRENESATPHAEQTASATSIRTTHQDDDSGASIHHAASDGGSSSSSCDSDSGSSGCD